MKTPSNRIAGSSSGVLIALGAFTNQFHQFVYEHIETSSHWNGFLARIGTAVHRLWFVRVVVLASLA